MSTSTISESDYRRLKADIETARAEALRAKGALDQLMAQLQQDYDCATLKEAKEQLEALTARRDRLNQKFQEALTAYQEKWKT